MTSPSANKHSATEPPEPRPPAPRQLRGAVTAALVLVALIVTGWWGHPWAQSKPEHPQAGRLDNLHPRDRLFALDPDSSSSLSRAILRKPSRLHILFHPAPGACTPEEARVAKALNDLGDKFTDIALWTVLPQGLDKTTQVYGVPLPGTLLYTSISEFQKSSRLAPLPRLEAWGHDGTLLLMRSVPRVVTQEAIHEEVLWARSFTTPLDDMSAHGDRRAMP